MKLPVKPPDFLSIINNSPHLLEKAISANPLDEKGRYLHWDKLRHLTPPQGLTSEEWWAITRFRRQSLSVSLPLHDKAGRPFNFCIPDTLHRDLHQLDMTATGKIPGNQPLASPAMQNTFRFRSLAEESIRSSQLEGASTTYRVAKEMLRQGRRPSDKSEQMIFNNYHAMQFIRELRDDELTPSLILELHKILMEDTLDESEKAGVLRSESDEVYVTDRTGAGILHSPPNASELPRRMDALCAFANQVTENPFVHPIVQAIALHFMLAYDHPFVDGNGRTARALFYWSMIRRGYLLTELISISRIIKQSPTQYGRAFLHTETDGNDLTYFIIHQIGIIKQAMEDLNNYMDQRTKDLTSTHDVIKSAQIPGIEKLNHRQLSLLRHALDHPRFVYNINEHRNSHGISYETARQDLLQLSDKLKLLNKLKDGKTFIFISPDDLKDQLKRHH